jgi:hypothetical protein
LATGAGELEGGCRPAQGVSFAASAWDASSWLGLGGQRRHAGGGLARLRAAFHPVYGGAESRLCALRRRSTQTPARDRSRPANRSDQRQPDHRSSASTLYVRLKTVAVGAAPVTATRHVPGRCGEGVALLVRSGAAAPPGMGGSPATPTTFSGRAGTPIRAGCEVGERARTRTAGFPRWATAITQQTPSVHVQTAGHGRSDSRPGC